MLLTSFTLGWNNHGIRTAHGLFPNQLYIQEMSRLRSSGMTALDFFDSINEQHYGVEEAGFPSWISKQGC